MRIEDEAKKLVEEMRKMGFAAQTMSVTKNNGVKLQAILPEVRNGLAPQVYLNHFDLEKWGTTELAMEIIDILKKYQKESLGFSVDLKDYGIDDVFFKVVSARMFSYEDVTVFPVADLVYVPYLLFSKSEEGVASTLVTKQLEEALGIDVSKEFEKVKENTLQEFPVVIKPLKDLLQMATGIGMEVDAEMPMIVVTNSIGVNGATSALLAKVYKDLAEDWGDVVVLPSSIHEIICIPGSYGAEDLSKMVQEVNSECVMPEEVLENHAYVYRKEKDCLEVMDV